ncbi:MAG: hypothetical protein SGJ19_28405 [Planctomycetia bacterium]|nr:hypothetical protein [Planctomycetia bacterium]
MPNRSSRRQTWHCRCGIAFVAIVAGARICGAEPLTYEPARDPAVGFNLISWWNFGANGENIWRSAVRDMHSHGFGHVSLCPIRVFNPVTGAISESPQLPSLAQVAAAADEARQLGMTVTINPFIEPEGFEFWRGTWDPPRMARERFWGDYEQYISEVAAMAEDNEADRLLVGTELRAITRNVAHKQAWGETISAAAEHFTGKIGYAANHDEYDGSSITSSIWEHPDIDFIGVDAYHPLTTPTQADASGPYPDEAFIDIVRDRWNEILDEEILPFAAARKGGAGMEVVFTETGLVPFNRTTSTPWNFDTDEDSIDQGEQLNGYEALIEAIDGRRDLLGAVHLWQWGMPGAAGSPFYLNPDGVNVPSSGFDESLGAPAARYLSDYVRTARQPGDTNADGLVNVEDLNAVRNHYGESGGNVPGDADGNGVVGIEDLNAVRNNFGAGQPANSVPEPHAVVMLLVGVISFSGLRFWRSL